MKTYYHNIFLSTVVLALGAIAVPSYADVVTSGDWQYDGNTIVKYLGKDASVTVPATLDGNAITNLGAEAFSENPNVLNITLSEGITTLDEYALHGIRHLRSINIPKTLSTVNAQAQLTIDNIYAHSLESWVAIDYVETQGLGNNSNLYIIKGTEPQWTEAVTEYTYSAKAPLKYCSFAGIRNLKKVDLTGCTSIPAGAFLNCTSLSDVKYSEGLIEIGSAAFANVSVADIILPQSVKTIGGQAYNNCTSVRQIYLGRNLETIGKAAFYGFPSSYPVTVAAITPPTGGSAAFQSDVRRSADLFVPEGSEEVYKNDWNFTYVYPCSETDAEWEVTDGYITAYKGTSIIVEIPQYVGVDFIKGFNSEAFQGNTSITSVTLPGLMGAIPDGAFKGCTSLRDVVFEGDIKEIPVSAFEDCTSLESISLPETVTKIGKRAFANSGLLDFLVPESLTTVEESAFEGCNIEQVNCRTRQQWVGLHFANPQANPIHCHARLFFNGVEVKILSCYEGNIRDYAFYGLESLQRIFLTETVMVGKEAFAGCKNVDWINFDDSLMMIEDGAFDGCGVPETLNLSFENIYSIGTNAFRKGDGNGTLKTINIGEEVTFIEPGAFFGHDEIEDIYVKRTTPPYLCLMSSGNYNYTGEAFSESVKENARLHVPTGCEAEYAEKWGFKNVLGHSGGVLIVKIPDGGNLSFANAKDLRLRIYPDDDNWELASAVLGDTDITDAINPDTYYNLGNIQGDVTLRVIFKKKEDSGVNSVAGDKSPVKLSVSDDAVNIEGATHGSEVKVYNTNGQLVTSTRNHSFQLNAKGVLILTVDGQTFKFVM